MLEGNFSPDEKEKKERELFRQKLEDSFFVKIDPTISSTELLAYIREGRRIMFIVDNNFNIFLTPGQHRFLLSRLKIEEGNCPISAGSFQIGSDGVINFGYHESKPVISVIPETAQTKIKQFLTSKGIEIANLI